MDQVIDKFGTKVQVMNRTDKTFDIQVQICVTGTFFAWLFQYVGEMSIVSPMHVKEAYINRLQDALDDELTDEPEYLFYEYTGGELKGHLTTGKAYEVSSLGQEALEITDDSGKKHFYDIKLFKPVQKL